MKNKIIPVTRSFDKNKIIGKLILLPDVEIIPDSVFALGYIPLEIIGDEVRKIELIEISLVSDKDYKKYLDSQNHEK